MSQEESLRAAVGRQRRLMSMNGILDLSKRIQCDDMTALGSQKALKVLCMDDSGIRSFATLHPQPLMKTLKANGSMIEVLTGLDEQPRLAKISLIGTPISETKNFRLSVLVGVGTMITCINGTAVSKKERKMASAYPPIAKRLVMAGWVVQFPPPSEADFTYLADAFQIKADKSEFVMPPFVQEDATNANESEDAGEGSFSGRLADILRPLGFGIRCGPKMNADIIASVAQICGLMEFAEKQPK